MHSVPKERELFSMSEGQTDKHTTLTLLVCTVYTRTRTCMCDTQCVASALTQTLSGHV